MRIFVPICLFAALVLLGAFGYAGKKATHTEASKWPTKEKVGIQKGDRAPGITLRNLQGKSVKLSDFRGKIVLINFWATWCTNCKAEMGTLQKYYQDHHTKGFVVLSVNDTTAEKNRQAVKNFMSRKKLTFPVVLDSNGIASGQYRVGGLPTSFFIGPKGQVQAENVGPLTYNTIAKVVNRIVSDTKS